MSLSDCVQCWETPCRCGHDYQHWTEAQVREQIEMLQKVLAQKVKKREELKEIDRQRSVEENPHRHWPFPTPNKKPGKLPEPPVPPTPLCPEITDESEKKRRVRKKPLMPAQAWPFPTKGRG